MSQTLVCLHLVLLQNFFSFGVLFGEEWPQFGGPNRDFRSSNLGNANSKNASSSMPTPWSIELNDGDAAPIVSNGNLYVSAVAFADDGHEALQIQCLNASTGTALWSQTLEERSYVSQDINDSYPVRPMASLVAAKGRIVSVSFGGCVACLDAQDGSVTWQLDLVKDFGANPLQFGWSSSPWSDGNNVVVACGGTQAMLLALDLETGKVSWKAGQGEVAYGSISQAANQDGSSTLCYVGGDEMIGVKSTDGELLWKYPLPLKGLTNAVTPIACGQGKWLVAGQGFDGCRLLDVSLMDGKWHVNEVWKASKFSPFYCNWLVEPNSQQVFSYNSSRLSSIDFATGETKWQTRGWTDVNFAITGSQVVGVRGDGLMSLSKPTDTGLVVTAGARVVNDRVWAPPVVVDRVAYLRGRRSLSSVVLAQLPPLTDIPSGTMIDSMKVMYGEKNEKLVALLEKATESPSTFKLEDYLAIVEDRSIRFSEDDYRSLFDALQNENNTAMKIQLAENWVRCEPDSIVAFDKLAELLESNGTVERLEQLKKDRLVELTLEVTLPAETHKDTSVFVTGNAAAMGSWKTDALLLRRADDGCYRTKIQVPKGNLQFKFTGGTLDTGEVRVDGRSTSSRRHRMTQSVTLKATVQAWKPNVTK